MRVLLLLFAFYMPLTPLENSTDSQNEILIEISQVVPTNDVLRVQRKGCEAKLNIRRDGNISVVLVENEKTLKEIIELKSGHYSLAIPKAKERMYIFWHTASYHSDPLVIGLVSEPRPEFELDNVKVSCYYHEAYHQGFFDVEINWSNPLPVGTIFATQRPRCFLSGSFLGTECLYHSNTSVKILSMPSRKAIQTGMSIMVFDEENCVSLYPAIHINITDCSTLSSVYQPPCIQPDNVVNKTAWFEEDTLDISWLSSPLSENVSVYALRWGYAGDLPEGRNEEFPLNTTQGFTLKEADREEQFQSASFNLSMEAFEKDDIIIQVVPLSHCYMTVSQLAELYNCQSNDSSRCRELLTVVFSPERVDLRVTSVHEDSELSSHIESRMESIEPVIASKAESDSSTLKENLDKINSDPTEEMNSEWVTIGVPVLAFSVIFLGTFIATILYKNRKLQKNHSLDHLLQPNPLYHSLYKNIREADRWEIAAESIEWGDQIGSGAFGAVYKCELQDWTADGERLQIVAAKTLANEYNALSYQQFIEEMLVMKELDEHPNIIRLIGCVTLSQPACLITEYAANGDLLSYLQSIRLRESGEEDDGKTMNLLQYGHLIQIAVDVAAGMEYISDKGYVHRDLAARNLLLDECYTVKIADFGLTRLLATEGVYIALNSKLLPVKWLSVEALTDLTFSPASDVWAFGVVLFELVTLGETPYPTIDPTDMLRYLVNGNRMGRPANCSVALYELMLRCWKPKPEDRPTFRELNTLLRELHPSYKSDKTNGHIARDITGFDVDEGCGDDSEVLCKPRLLSESSNYSEVNMIISSPDLERARINVNDFVSQSECNSVSSSQSHLDDVPRFYIEIYDQDSEKKSQRISSTRL
ncbi:uncharacterized protein [Watersipora subatra]|uniref:uncharacterized protein n=1 Tax=Watersipora subatra TaxID=2589382 RepID=UPI00355C88B0